ncbi:ABC transporter permease [Virgibacillus necropolis]|uniref:ABC transporter ATP-binding protein n=1 Tax=Virgibacillus necropolis TaxID=163877 RepID=A0A221MBJ7_9BACI|nr:ABC transporter permease [Virgibacillus necropolis]ASN05046.1 ABC transporter ATP-binding protein [Virgibacillus necropolis]
MLFFHHVFLFVKNNVKQLQRKWPSLPLLFLFPIIMVGLSAYIVLSFFVPEDNKTIHVGLIDHDQSRETTMVIELIEESSQLNNFIQLEAMSSKEAKQALKNNNLSAYITFPENFTDNLYNGTPVTLDIIGNPTKPIESFLARELIDSVSRHIKTAQANILTINFYAQQLEMDEETRNDFLFKKFTEFVFYTLGKDKILDEEMLTNNAASSPVKYYGLGGLFIIITVWLLTFYSILTREDEAQMKNRMRLYNVTHTNQLVAKIIVSWLATIFFTSIIFCGFITLFDIQLFFSDYRKIAILIFIYSFVFLLGLAIIEVILTAPKIRLLTQTLYTGILLLVSGAIVPTLYYPIYVQDILPYSFAYQAFHWLQEIILNNRVYVDYLPLALYLIISALIFLGLSTWKERVSQ